MKILNYYLGKTVLTMTLLVMVVLGAMDFFIHLVAEFTELGKGDYGLMQALLTVTLSVPQDLYQLFPMIGLLGCLIGLGTLASHSELIVMRAATVSTWQITRALLMTIATMAVVMTLFGEFVGPKLQRIATHQKAVARSQGQAIKTAAGVWLREGPYFYHIAKAKRSKTLMGITRYEFDQKHHLVAVAHGDQATMIDAGRWQVENVQETDFKRIGIKSHSRAKEVWNMDLQPVLLKVAEVEPEDMPLPKLYRLVQYQRSNNLDYHEYALVFWQRIFQPLASCVMMFLAVPFIFGPLRTMTMGLRIVIGIVTGFSFYLLNQFLGPLSLVLQFPPLLAAIFPTLFFALISLLGLRAVR